MRKVIATTATIVIFGAAAVFAQSQQTIDAIRQAVPYSQMQAQLPGLTLADYDAAVRAVAKDLESSAVPRSYVPPSYAAPAPSIPTYSAPSYSYSVPTYSAPQIYSGTNTNYLGTLSTNQYDPNSTSNPYGTYGSPYSPNSINNPYGTYGSQYSPYSVTNPYAVGTAPKIYGSDGQYLGRLSANPYDPESTSNPYGIYGSRYSPTSINNPYSIYGSPYSPASPKNPYAVTPPIIISPNPDNQ